VLIVGVNGTGKTTTIGKLAAREQAAGKHVILAAADCYGAMREERPYRAALDTPAAEAELLREADEGRLDREAVDAVLAAAGHSVRQRSRELPAGLTERELEVLLVLVHGRSNQEIAVDLGISAKTVGHHVQHVYEKAGVRSRAGEKPGVPGVVVDSGRAAGLAPKAPKRPGPRTEPALERVAAWGWPGAGGASA